MITAEMNLGILIFDNPLTAGSTPEAMTIAKKILAKIGQIENKKAITKSTTNTRIIDDVEISNICLFKL